MWNILGTMLANTGPASDEQIDWLTWIDPLFIVGITLLTWWAFGWRTTCVALAVFATNFPSRFYWTGGAFLRWDWLFYFVGGICLVKKDQPMLGGFFLGYSTLLRIFPVFMFTGPMLVALRQMWGTHAPDDPHWLVRVPDLGCEGRHRQVGRGEDRPRAGVEPDSHLQAAAVHDVARAASRASTAATWRCSSARRWRSRR